MNIHDTLYKIASQVDAVGDQPKPYVPTATGAVLGTIGGGFGSLAGGAAGYALARANAKERLFPSFTPKLTFSGAASANIPLLDTTKAVSGSAEMSLGLPAIKGINLKELARRVGKTGVGAVVGGTAGLAGLKLLGDKLAQ